MARVLWIDKKLIKSGEKAVVTECNSNGEVQYVITTKQNDTSWYYLYKFENDKLIKMGRAKTPPELEEQFTLT